MAFYDKFPYTNFQELNLDRLIQELMTVKQGLDFVIENSSLKYADPLQWNITKQYQANTVVIDPATGIAYLSTKPVPNNVQITDTGYWTQIFDLSALFNDIEDDIAAVANALSSETSAREAADTQITNAYQAADTALASSVSTETANREAADTALASSVSTETANREAADSDITEAYQAADSALSETINNNYSTIMELLNHVALGNNPSVLTVGKVGCRFTRINDAIDYARNYATTQNRVTIVIFSGSYEEEIVLNPNPGIDFVGYGQPEVRANSVYPNAPIYIFGKTSVSGITFQNDNAQGNAYALHIEQQSNAGIAMSGEMVFRDCMFISQANAPIGIGMGEGVVRFYQCSFWAINPNSPSLYLHNYPQNAGYQNLDFYRCDLHSVNQISVLVQNSRAMQGNPGTSPLVLNFQNCMLEYGKVPSFYDGTTSSNTIPSSGEVTLNISSLGNNAAGLNYNP